MALVLVLSFFLILKFYFGSGVSDNDTSSKNDLNVNSNETIDNDIKTLSNTSNEVIFDELENEFVGKEEYEKAQLMLNAKLDLDQDKKLNDLLNGSNIVYPSYRAKEDN